MLSLKNSRLQRAQQEANRLVEEFIMFQRVEDVREALFVKEVDFDYETNECSVLFETYQRPKGCLCLVEIGKNTGRKKLMCNL